MTNTEIRSTAPWVVGAVDSSILKPQAKGSIRGNSNLTTPPYDANYQIGQRQRQLESRTKTGGSHDCQITTDKMYAVQRPVHYSTPLGAIMVGMIPWRVTQPCEIGGVCASKFGDTSSILCLASSSLGAKIMISYPTRIAVIALTFVLNAPMTGHRVSIAPIRVDARTTNDIEIAYCSFASSQVLCPGAKVGHSHEMPRQGLYAPAGWPPDFDRLHYLHC